MTRSIITGWSFGLRARERYAEPILRSVLKIGRNAITFRKGGVTILLVVVVNQDFK